jgi:transposase-like protein
MHSGVLNSIKKSVNRLKTNLGPHETLPCEYCRANETFATEIDVIEHVKAMHPIQCPDCPMKMFKYPTSVRKHFRKFHPQEVPYFCRTCTLVFKVTIKTRLTVITHVPYILYCISSKLARLGGLKGPLGMAKRVK